jgi:hypothetical protein
MKLTKDSIQYIIWFHETEEEKKKFGRSGEGIPEHLYGYLDEEDFERDIRCWRLEDTPNKVCRDVIRMMLGNNFQDGYPLFVPPPGVENEYLYFSARYTP